MGSSGCELLREHKSYRLGNSRAKILSIAAILGCK
jgi:hypothetical protein